MHNVICSDQDKIIHLDRVLHLQSLEDDHGGAWGAGGIVIQEQLQFHLEATEVCGRAERLGAQVLDRAEGFRISRKLSKTIQQHPVYRL